MQEQIVALLIAVLPASLAFWAKLRTESLAGRRLVVSYLLQIRHAIICSSLTSDKLLKGFDGVFVRLCNNHGLSEQHDKEAIQRLRLLIANMYEEAAQNLLPNLDSEFWVEFSGALKALRKEEPLIAFQLVGWEKDLAYLTMKQDYAKQFTAMEEISSVDLVKQLLEQHFTEDHQKSFLEVARHFDSLVRTVAKSAGIRTYIKIFFYLRKQPTKMFTFDEERTVAELENVLETMFVEILKHELPPTN